MKRITARDTARFGLLAAIALILGYLERLIPIAPGIPGIRLGLGNTALLYSIYLIDRRQTILLMAVKVLLGGLLFSGPAAMMYSLAGGVASLAAMLPLSRLDGMGVMGVSIAGAVAHNLGQLAVACLVITPKAALWYAPVLIAAAIIAGALTGIIAKYAVAALGAHEK